MPISKKHKPQPIFELSILPYAADLDNHLKQIKDLIAAGIDYLHLDIMRHDFVARDAFPIPAVAKLSREFIDKINFDFHLMAARPDLIFFELAQLIPLAKRKNIFITLHYETLGADKKKFINQIKQAGFKTGLALNPKTNLTQITPDLAKLIDLILIMTVAPGKGGQKFLPAMLSKIKSARQKFPNRIIQVDGGINSDTAALAIKAGASNLVIGSYLTRAPSPAQAVNNLKSIIHNF